MKIIHEEGNVVKSYGLQEESTFKINTNAHAFRMLSSGLYSDKESAVLREIGCNAHDAHVSVGKADTPFDVKLPNKIDNQFYIRDYGPGLSDEDIKGLYTTYFASTKQDSNDYTGAFGLGSKSPFSYTDSFTITSYFGGYCRIYSAHIGSRGNPQIALMSESESTETGICIGFPVKPQDFEAFRTKATAIFRWFKTVPNIIGGDIVTPVVYKLSNNDWGFVDEYTGQPYILMGNVRYRLDRTKLGACDKLQNQIVSMNNLILKFPIGKVQVAASREELQYDEDSVKAIKESLTTIGKSVVATVEAAWQNRITWADKCKFKDNIHTINQGIYFDEEMYRLAGAKDPKGLFMAGGTHGFMVGKPVNHDQLHISLFMIGRKGIQSRNVDNSTFSLPYNSDLKIVQGDAVRAHARAKKAIADGKLKECLLIYPFKKNKGDLNDVVQATKQIEGSTGQIEIVQLSSFDPPPKVVRAKKGQLPPLPTGLGTTKLYVPYWNGGKRVVFNGEIGRWNWRNIKDSITTLKTIVPLKEPEEIPLKDVKKLKLELRSDWMLYDKHVKEVLEDATSLDILGKEIKKHKTVVSLHSVYYSEPNVLELMVRLKHQHKNLFTLIEPDLQKAGVLDTINEVYKNSVAHLAPVVAPKVSEYLSAYKTALAAVGSTIQQPELKQADISSKLPKMTKLKLSDMITVHNLSANAYITMMKEYLN